MTGIPTSAGLEAGAVERCPMCGFSAHLRFEMMFRQIHHFVECQDVDCLTRGPARLAKPDALEAWNRRSTLIPPSRAEPVAWRGIVDGRTAFLCRTKDELARLAADYNATIEPLVPAPRAVAPTEDLGFYKDLSHEALIGLLKEEFRESARRADTIMDLRRKLEEARKALEPFGKWSAALDGEFADHDGTVIAAGIHGATVTFGDLRRARAITSGGDHG